MKTLFRQGGEPSWAKAGSSPEIHIAREVLNKMFLYAALCKDELSGLGTVEIVEGAFRITDIRVFEQECTQSDTEIDNEDLTKFFTDVINRGEDQTKWRLWWHSHATMGVFFSSTDVECAEKLLESFGDYVVSLVVNKKGELYGRINYSKPVPLILCNAPVFVVDPNTADLEKELEAEIKQKVKTKVYSYQGTHNYSGPPYNGQGNFNYGGLNNRGTKIISDKEPFRTGVWDNAQKIWRHKQSLKVWDFKTDEWVRDNTKPPQCEKCFTTTGKITYSKHYDGFLCKDCKRDRHEHKNKGITIWRNGVQVQEALYD